MSRVVRGGFEETVMRLERLFELEKELDIPIMFYFSS